MELLLVIGVVLAICAVDFGITRLVAAVLRRAAGYFVTAVKPPSLMRLTSIVARRLEEWHAAEAASRGRDPLPPPEIVLALRAFTRRDRSSIARTPSP